MIRTRERPRRTGSTVEEVLGAGVGVEVGGRGAGRDDWEGGVGMGVLALGLVTGMVRVRGGRPGTAAIMLGVRGVEASDRGRGVSGEVS